MSKGKKEETAVQEDADREQHLTKRERPKILKGWTYQMQTGCGPLYITINEDDKGLFELFTTMGKSGGCAASQSEAIGRMVSLAWRSGLSSRQVIKQLQGISCHSPSGFGENKILSCADAVARAIQSHIEANGGKVQHEKSYSAKAPVRTAAALWNMKAVVLFAACAVTANAHNRCIGTMRQRPSSTMHCRAIPLSRSYLKKMRLSTIETPLPCSWTITGFKSISAMSGTAARRLDTRQITSAKASISAFIFPLAPCRIG